MSNKLQRFEKVTRRLTACSDISFSPESDEHPFERRNIWPQIPSKVRQLFDDGHYAEATFEAMKFLDKEVQRHCSSAKIGFKLMMEALSEEHPLIRLTGMQNESGKVEQQGFKFLFAGAVLAIRDPRGHEYAIKDDPDTCLDHLCFISMLLRRLAQFGYK